MRPTSPLPVSGPLVGPCIKIRYYFGLIQVEEFEYGVTILITFSFPYELVYTVDKFDLGGDSHVTGSSIRANYMVKYKYQHKSKKVCPLKHVHAYNCANCGTLCEMNALGIIRTVWVHNFWYDIHRQVYVLIKLIKLKLYLLGAQNSTVVPWQKWCIFHRKLCNWH